MSKLLVKYISSTKDILLGLTLGALIGILILETKTEPKLKFYHKVMSHCNTKSSSLIEMGIRKYWQIRNIQSKEIENKNDLVELLFLASYIGDSICNAYVFEELDTIAIQGYKFKEYQDNKQRSWILKEVLMQNPLTVNWLLENRGFVITGVTSKPSPYYGENIFELSVSIDKDYSTSSTKKIMLMLNEIEASL